MKSRFPKSLKETLVRMRVYVCVRARVCVCVHVCAGTHVCVSCCPTDAVVVSMVLCWSSLC
jgi:hypothetical protein